MRKIINASMIWKKERKKINKILRNNKSPEGKFLVFSNIDLSDDCFTDESFINEFKQMCSIRSQIQDLKDQLASLYAINA